MVYYVTHEANTEEMTPLVYGGTTIKETEMNDSVDGQVEINPDDLKIQKEVLGSGHFGEVHLGILQESDGKHITVAVKSSKKSNDASLSKEERATQFIQQLKSLQREASIMSNMGRHPNVLRMIGAVTKNLDDFCVVTEYCEYGSLDKYLSNKEKQRKFINEYIVKGSDGYQMMPSEFHWKIQEDSSWEASFWSRRKEGFVMTTDLMYYGLQIAQAMDFLIRKCILHRDMASRNVLLTGDHIIKVGDFGLSRVIVDGIYQPLNATEMPIGYLAPEVLQFRRYSPKSESWTFGIVLWELFTLAGRQPYLCECGVVDEPTVSAYLGADKRLPLSDITPVSMRKLISQLWSKTPSDRPDFKTSHKKIIEDLHIANPQLAALARKMYYDNCGHYLSNSLESLISDEVVDEKQLTKIQIDFNQSTKKNITKHLLRNRLLLAVALFTNLLLFAFLMYSHIKPTKSQASRFVAARWSWSFNTSDVYNTPLESRLNGLRYEMDLSVGCDTLKWQPYLKRIQGKENQTDIPFFLEYISGPSNLRAWRSMVLIAGDGREIMVGNDFHRNGWLYTENNWDNTVWAVNPKFLSNSSDNNPLTLKIEVFVDPAWAGCEAEKAVPNKPINYEEECNRVPTNTKVYFNGACYVGSNTMTQFPYVLKLCNDISSAAISRLAWIESGELMNKLRAALIIHDRSGKKENVPYWVGAKQFSEQNVTILSPPDKNWYWIDSAEIPRKPFPANFSLWTNGEPDDHGNADERYAAIFKEQKNLSDVTPSEWFRYLCEYRDTD